MVQPENVTALQRPGYAVDPPVIVLRLARFPAIYRISPALARNAERVRRDASDHGGRKVFIQVKDVTIAPDVRAVKVDKDCHIANDLDAALVAILSQRAPLLEERKLNGAFGFQVRLKLQAKFMHRLGITMGQSGDPRTPRGPCVMLAHHIKENEILQPPGL